MEPMTHTTEALEEKVINDTSACHHDFILRGVREAQCKKCGLGVFINGIEDYDRLKRLATKNK